MVFCTVNVALDFRFFEVSLTYILNRPIVCLFLVNIPRNYSSSDAYHKVLSNMICIQTNNYLFIVKRPASFRPLFSGTSGVVYGILSYEKRSVGVIASNHFDCFGETTDIVNFYLPVILSCLSSLFVGSPDFSDAEVPCCTEVYILGSLSTCDYPVAEEYVWPILSDAFPEEFPPHLYCSRVQRASCLNLPFTYNWLDAEVYLPYDGVTDPKVLRARLNKATSQIEKSTYNELRLASDVVTSNSVDPSSIFPFIRFPYDSSIYKRWMDNSFYRDLKVGSEDMFFSSCWVQHLSTERDSLYAIDECAHPFSSNADIVDACIDTTLDPLFESVPDIDFYIYHPLEPMDDLVNTEEPVDLDETNFVSSLDRYAEALRSPRSLNRVGKLGDSVVFKRRMDQCLVRSLQACRVIPYSDLGTTEPQTCVFNMPHDT